MRPDAEGRLPPAIPTPDDGRVHVDGRHLRRHGTPFRVRGVSYGSFAARSDGALFPSPDRIAADMAAIAGIGLNVVRTYSVPPLDLLASAATHGLHVLAGLQYDDWRYERHPTRAATRRVIDRARAAMDTALDVVGERREVLALSIGNEIPVDVVRLHGTARVQGAMESLVELVHDADPDRLVTYGNFPTTEFLIIENLDLVSFNVFLERPDALQRYLRHLQIVAGDRPLLISELGLASDIHGRQAQAESLAWQLRTVDNVGCAGATVFSWTDDWAVGGSPVSGWGFGITDQERRPKPAVSAVSEWTGRSLADLHDAWPTLSVIVCAYNEEATLAQCLESVLACDYPGLDVVVCDDGSTDATAAIARRYPFRLLELPHAGLSVARNAGLAAARGDIIAYLDADAACHPEWPYHLALSLSDGVPVATGGPNLPMRDAVLVERAVALSPGAPVEVLIADDRAEHVPGCNMAFRREALAQIGGFNPVYTSAGDDVDVCWKLLDRGEEIAFAAAAQVRHHRRGTVWGYLRQQRGYGRAERLLWSRHRHRFNRLGQARWSGTIYGTARVLPALLRPVVYHGYMGTAPFQPRTRRRDQTVAAWGGALLPFVAVFAVLGLPLGIVHPLGWWIGLAGIGVIASFACAIGIALPVDRHEPHPLRLRSLAALLHVTQPLARSWGRLTAERRPPEPVQAPDWYGNREWWLMTLDRTARAERCDVVPAGPTDEHDVELRRGPFVAARVTTAVVWNWEPMYGVALRLRWGRAAAAAAAVSGTAAWKSAGAAAVLGIVVLILVLGDAVTLRTAVNRALSLTTSRSTGSACPEDRADRIAAPGADAGRDGTESGRGDDP